MPVAGVHTHELDLGNLARVVGGRARRESSRRDDITDATTSREHPYRRGESHVAQYTEGELDRLCLTPPWPTI